MAPANPTDAPAVLSPGTPPQGATAVLLLDDGTTLWGAGYGAAGAGVGELCFNTAMTGYQEILTDPSYAGQIITFTFPHIGNVGTNSEDMERDRRAAVGCITRELPTQPSSFRSEQPLADWMVANGLIGIGGIDTRALTRRIRDIGAPNAVVAHSPNGIFDMDALQAMVRNWKGLEGSDLAKDVSRKDVSEWTGGVWTLGHGYAAANGAKRPHVVAMDFGAKDNIFRRLVEAGAKVTVVPATTTVEEIFALQPDGVFLSNGPGDPAATGEYVVPVVQALLEKDMPIFGICFGHQLLGLAAGAKTIKMRHGHRGANHPVQRAEDGVVEITSMNHGFSVDAATLPDHVVETHKSLFDGSNCGIAFTNKRAFSVQHHPEASPGPQDSLHLFTKFVNAL